MSWADPFREGERVWWHRGDRTVYGTVTEPIGGDVRDARPGHLVRVLPDSPHPPESGAIEIARVHLYRERDHA